MPVLVRYLSCNIEIGQIFRQTVVGTDNQPRKGVVIDHNSFRIDLPALLQRVRAELAVIMEHIR